MGWTLRADKRDLNRGRLDTILGHSKGAMGRDDGRKSLKKSYVRADCPRPQSCQTKSDVRRGQNDLSGKKAFHSTGFAPQSAMRQLPKQLSSSTRSAAIFVISDPSAFIVKMLALSSESPRKAIFLPSGE
jgi:hypothetical protein